MKLVETLPFPNQNSFIDEIWVVSFTELYKGMWYISISPNISGMGSPEGSIFGKFCWVASWTKPTAIEIISAVLSGMTAPLEGYGKAHRPSSILFAYRCKDAMTVFSTSTLIYSRSTSILILPSTFLALSRLKRRLCIRPACMIWTILGGIRALVRDVNGVRMLISSRGVRGVK
jgi:hypothetical protein